jgi:hypothetical protein
MTLPAFSERVGRALAEVCDKVQKEATHSRIRFTVTVGKQTFVVTCEEGPSEHWEPEV